MIFELLFITLIAFSNAITYSGEHSINDYKINYDVKTNYEIYKIGKNDQILFCDNEMLIFNTTNNKNIYGQIVTTDECDYFTGKISNMETFDNIIQYIAVKININDVFESGTINIQSNDKNLTKEVDVPFCFGFNADGTCKRPSSIIPLFNNKIMKVTCDNCFVGFSGEMFIDIELSLFKIKKVAIGFKNMYLKGGIGVELDAVGKYSYIYDKIYKVLEKFHIITFPIGPIKFEIMLDLPIEIYLSTYANANTNINIGSNLDINIGGLYLLYENGKFKVIKPSPITNYEQYMITRSTIDGDVEFKILPTLSIYDSSIFKFNVMFEPITNLVVRGTSIEKKVCVNGNYEFSINTNGNILTDKIPNTIIYDTGKKSFIEKCYSV